MSFQMQPGDAYEIELDDTNKIVCAWEIEGQERKPVAFDLLDPSLGRFLTWLSGLSPKRQEGIDGLLNLPGGGNYITHRDQLIRICRSEGLVLAEEAWKHGRGPWKFRIAMGHFNLPAKFGLSLSAKADSSTPMLFFKLLFAVPSTYSADPDRYGPALYISNEILTILENEAVKEESDAAKLVAKPVVRTFAYVDISDFSKFTPSDQMHAITSLGRILRIRHFAGQNRTDGLEPGPLLESAICIGDGYILVFRDAHDAVFNSCLLACAIEELTSRGEVLDFHFRIGINTGEVLRFWDDVPSGVPRWNYVGVGITNAQRVLDAMGKDQDDVVYVSASTRAAARKSKINERNPIDGFLTNRGRREDKHRQMQRIYEANHSAWILANGLSPFMTWLRGQGWL